MKLYTKTGDKGTSGLLHGVRKLKTDDIFEVLGTIDELIAHLGVFHAEAPSEMFSDFANDIQNLLMDVASQIAGQRIDLTSKLNGIEGRIDFFDSLNRPLTKFIVPGGCKHAAQMHVCRAVARRLERAYLQMETRDEDVQIFFNRLSDLFFAVARAVNQKVEIYRT